MNNADRNIRFFTGIPLPCLLLAERLQGQKTFSENAAFPFFSFFYSII